MKVKQWFKAQNLYEHVPVSQLQEGEIVWIRSLRGGPELLGPYQYLNTPQGLVFEDRQGVRLPAASMMVNTFWRLSLGDVVPQDEIDCLPTRIGGAVR